MKNLYIKFDQFLARTGGFRGMKFWPLYQIQNAVIQLSELSRVGSARIMEHPFRGFYLGSHQ